jgi:hypothetical protein
MAGKAPSEEPSQATDRKDDIPKHAAGCADSEIPQKNTCEIQDLLYNAATYFMI